MKKYLTLFAAVMLMTACSNEDQPAGNQPSSDAIGFDVAVGSLTRAVGDITDDNLKTSERGFGVFASYTGSLTYENTTVSPDYMFNQQVKYSSDAWNYSPVKYWPNDSREYVSFFAYAPYEANPADDGRCIIDMSKYYDKGDPWLNYRLSVDPWDEDGNDATEAQVDLLYGVNEGSATGLADDTPWLDQQKATYGLDGKLKFTFKHALASIGDEITIKMSDELKELIDGYAEVTIDKVTINYKNLTNKARLVLKCANGPEWREIISGELTVNRQLVIDDLEASTFAPLTSTAAVTLSTGKGLFYIPMRIEGTDKAVVEIVLNYTVKVSATDETYSGVASDSFDLSIVDMEGKKQAIALTLTKSLDLNHLVYEITDDTATEPSYSPRRFK